MTAAKVPKVVGFRYDWPDGSSQLWEKKEHAEKLWAKNERPKVHPLLRLDEVVEMLRELVKEHAFSIGDECNDEFVQREYIDQLAAALREKVK